jgi:hypothetical protein
MAASAIFGSNAIDRYKMIASMNTPRPIQALVETSPPQDGPMDWTLTCPTGVSKSLAISDCTWVSWLSERLSVVTRQPVPADCTITWCTPSSRTDSRICSTVT